MIDKIKDYLTTISPNKRNKLYKILVIGGGILLVILIVIVFGGNQKKINFKKLDKTQVKLLDDDTYKQAWMADQGAKIKALESKVDRIERNLVGLTSKIDGLASNVEKSVKDVTKLMSNNLENQITELQKEQMKIIQNLKNKEQEIIKNINALKNDVNVNPNKPNVTKNNVKSKDSFNPEEFDINKIIYSDNKQKGNSDTEIKELENKTEVKETKLPATPKLKIVKDVLAIKKEQEEAKKQTYIPAGTLIGAVLLSGLDAPTGGSVQANPHPVLLMVDKKAILPNKFSMDFRQCFVIGSGYGDMSTERAYLRLETLSCVKNDNSVIESSIYGYIVGSDGKLGIRGRLVSRQGSLIAKSLVAGFFSGLSEALKPERIPQIKVDDNGDSSSSTQYVAPNVADVMKSGTYSGFSNALEKIANFYLEMAEKMFPLVEISAGTKVEMVLTKGVSLNLGSNNSATKDILASNETVDKPEKQTKQTFNPNK